MGDREWALNQPGTPPDAIKAAALADAFYGVRADAVAIAAHLGDADTVDAALHDGTNASASPRRRPPAR